MKYYRKNTDVEYSKHSFYAHYIYVPYIYASIFVFSKGCVIIFL